MLGDIVFVLLCFVYFTVTASLIIGIDFLIFAFTGKSVLCAIEHFLYDKFGQ